MSHRIATKLPSKNYLNKECLILLLKYVKVDKKKQTSHPLRWECLIYKDVEATSNNLKCYVSQLKFQAVFLKKGLTNLFRNI